MSEPTQRPDSSKSPKRREKGADEKFGQALGKAFGKLKRTRVWKDTAKAYRDGLEGKPEK